MSVRIAANCLGQTQKAMQRLFELLSGRQRDRYMASITGETRSEETTATGTTKETLSRE
jgi:hypothetical protein